MIGWLREKLWYIATLIALSTLFGWFLGSWSAGWSVVEALAITFTVVGFAWLIWAGWVEWRQGREVDRE